MKVIDDQLVLVNKEKSTLLMNAGCEDFYSVGCRAEFPDYTYEINE